MINDDDNKILITREFFVGKKEGSFSDNFSIVKVRRVYILIS